MSYSLFKKQKKWQKIINKIMKKRTQPINYNKLDLIDRQRLFEETVKEAEKQAKKEEKGNIK